MVRMQTNGVMDFAWKLRGQIMVDRPIFGVGSNRDQMRNTRVTTTFEDFGKSSFIEKPFQMAMAIDPVHIQLMKEKRCLRLNVNRNRLLLLEILSKITIFG